jgi:peptide/nickel transport system permease protein
VSVAIDVPIRPAAEPSPAASPNGFWRRLVRNRGAMVAFAFVILLVLIAVFAPAIAPHDPDRQKLLDRLQPPSGEHWLGTDGFGRDVFSRLIFATRVALTAALQAVGLALVLGGGAGVIAAYIGGVADTVLARTVDMLMALPGLVLALAIVGILGPGLTNAMVAIGILLTPRFFRVASGATQAVKHETYIEASRAIGCSSWRVMWRHVLPNINAPMLVQTTFAISIAIVAEAGLSFLGLGAQPPTASWGTMIDEGFKEFRQSSTLIIPPVVAIVATILAFSVLADGLQDAASRRGGRP